LGDQREDNSNRLLRQQTALAKFGEFTLRSSDLDQILTEACRLVGSALGTDLAKVVALQPDGHTLLVIAGVGWKPGVVGHATIEWRTIPRKVLPSRQANR
jgi:GAF domain-containing protein